MIDPIKITHTTHHAKPGEGVIDYSESGHSAATPNPLHTELHTTELDADGKLWMLIYRDGVLVSRVDAKDVML